MSLRKVALDSDREDHFVYIDPKEIRAIQVQYPTTSSALVVQGEFAVGVARVFINGMNNPFQFTRKTAEELNVLIEALAN